MLACLHTDTALMARGSRKENKEPNKGPNHMLRSPLQPTNGRRGKLRMALTVKSLPTKTETETDVGDPFLVTSGKWYVTLCLLQRMKVEYIHVEDYAVSLAIHKFSVGV